MGPSEAAIERAIDALIKSPGSFQRLAEAFAEIEFDEKFAGLVPRGRNSQDISVKGWPDFTSGANAGEATTGRDWRRHLRADIQAMQRRDSAGSYVFVAWAKDPTDHEKQEWASKIGDVLQVDTDKVRLVFKGELRRSLTMPRYARVWVEQLGLSSSCYPFSFLNAEAGPLGTSGLFGSSTAHSFLPSKSDYLSDRVYLPPAAAETAETLTRERWAYVRGRGAAGKSTLALSIALSEDRRKNPTYYLNLQSSDEQKIYSVDAVFDAISTRSDRNVLFIVDDIHLNNMLAAAIFDHWKAAGNAGYLLLLGRHDEVPTDSRGRTSPFAHLDAIDLKVDEVTLAAIFDRIVGHPNATLRPPQSALAQWHALFAGDLIAFSAAIQRRREQLVCGDWRLSPVDAAEYVRDRYLLAASDTEYANLLMLAVCCTLQQSLPFEAARRSDFRKSEAESIVFRRTSKSGRAVNFHLFHEGLARLILAAAGPDLDELQALCEIGRRSPSRGLGLARALEREGKNSHAVAIASAIWQDVTWPVRVRTLNTFLADLEALSRILSLSDKEIAERLDECADSIAEASLNSGFGDLMVLLPVLGRSYPTILNRIISRMADERGVEALLTRATGREFSSMLALLRMLAEHTQMRGLHERLNAKLFPSHMTSIVESWLGELNVTTVVLLLSYLEKYQPTLLRDVEKFYCAGEQIARLAVACVTDDIGLSLRLIQNPAIGPKLGDAVDRDKWWAARLTVAPRIANDFLGHSRGLRGRSARDLLIAPAVGIVRSSIGSDWPFASLSVSQVCEILRYAVGADSEALVSFLEKWLSDGKALDNRARYMVCEAMLESGGGGGSPQEEALLAAPVRCALLAVCETQDLSDPQEATAAIGLIGLARQIGVPMELRAGHIDEETLAIALELGLPFQLGAKRKVGTTFFFAGLTALEDHNAVSVSPGLREAFVGGLNVEPDLRVFETARSEVRKPTDTDP